MGMDIIEFVICIEKEFNLQIPDEDSEEIRTIQDLVSNIESITPNEVSPDDIRERIFKIFNSEFGITNLKGDENLVVLFDY